MIPTRPAADWVVEEGETKTLTDHARSYIRNHPTLGTPSFIEMRSFMNGLGRRFRPGGTHEEHADLVAPVEGRRQPFHSSVDPLPSREPAIEYSESKALTNTRAVINANEFAVPTTVDTLTHGQQIMARQSLRVQTAYDSTVSSLSHELELHRVMEQNEAALRKAAETRADDLSRQLEETRKDKAWLQEMVPRPARTSGRDIVPKA